ncbi:MAG: Capsular glucan synthase [Microgenomates bacterium OLB23]|nr:MAG: Capsular glucan synthase [Microgenomates bacterium OLB23]
MAIKKIGIDARLLAQTGVGVYIKNLLYELSGILQPSYQLVLYIRPQDQHLLPQLPSNTILRHTKAHWHSLAEQTLLLKQLLVDNLDLMHFCYFSMPILYNRPFVITIHDMIPYKHPTGRASTKNSLTYTFKHYMYKKVLLHAVQHAKKVFVPTNAVKQDMLTIFPALDHDRIVRTYEGVDKELIHATPTKPRLLLKSPYVLYMGNYYPHKQVEFLIDAYDKSSLQMPLVLCGPGDYFAQRIDRYIARKKSRQSILRLSNLTLGERAYVYAHARALVHPSKDEGFGLPLVEATYFGCPVIASDIPVFREVCAQATFFTTYSTNELTLHLNKLTGSTNAKKKYALLDKKFSFHTMAQETYNQYVKLL